MRFRVDIQAWIEAKSIVDAMWQLSQHYDKLVTDPEYNTSIFLPHSKAEIRLES